MIAKYFLNSKIIFTLLLTRVKLRKNGKFESDTVDINDPLTVELPPKGLHGKLYPPPNGQIVT